MRTLEGKMMMTHYHHRQQQHIITANYLPGTVSVNGAQLTGDTFWLTTTAAQGGREWWWLHPHHIAGGGHRRLWSHGILAICDQLPNGCSQRRGVVMCRRRRRWVAAAVLTTARGLILFRPTTTTHDKVRQLSSGGWGATPGQVGARGIVAPVVVVVGRRGPTDLAHTVHLLQAEA